MFESDVENLDVVDLRVSWCSKVGLGIWILLIFMDVVEFYMR